MKHIAEYLVKSYVLNIKNVMNLLLGEKKDAFVFLNIKKGRGGLCYPAQDTWIGLFKNDFSKTKSKRIPFTTSKGNLRWYLYFAKRIGTRKRRNDIGFKQS